jgi:hypothetical protein
MKPWEIWTYDFEDEQTHPVVIFLEWSASNGGVRSATLCSGFFHSPSSQRI